MKLISDLHTTQASRLLKMLSSLTHMMQTVQQCVYGLLHSNLLSGSTCHPDERTRLQCLFGCGTFVNYKFNSIVRSLSPAQLRCRLYPKLVAYPVVFLQPEQPLPLRMSMLDQADRDAVIFVLDAHTDLFIVYSEAAAHKFVDGPPDDSIIGRDIAQAKSRVVSHMLHDSQFTLSNKSPVLVHELHGRQACLSDPELARFMLEDQVFHPLFTVWTVETCGATQHDAGNKCFL